MGKFNALLDALGIVGKEAKAVGDDAAKALEKVTSAETAVGLEGEARGQYLKALDEIYGNKNQRAKLSGKNLKRIEERNLTEKYMKEEGLIPREIPEFSSNEKRFVSMKGPYDDYSSDFAFGKLGNNDAELYPSHKGKGIYKKMIEDNALKTGETVSKFNQRNKFSKKTWDSLVNQGLAKRDQKLGFDKIVKEEIENKLNRLPNAAFDPRFKDSPLLMAGGLAGANILPTTEQQLNPFARLSDVAGAWETAKEKVSKPLAKSLNLSGNPQDEAAFNQILKTGLDPLNFLPGAAGLAAGAAQMFAPSDEERAKKQAEDEMRRRVLNQMAGQ